jgi:hypothetical protein
MDLKHEIAALFCASVVLALVGCGGDASEVGKVNRELPVAEPLPEA